MPDAGAHLCPRGDLEAGSQRFLRATERIWRRNRDANQVLKSAREAERARLFAAEMALQSFALMAAADGAISGYADITGETWTAYEASASPAASVSRKSAAVEMAAFELAA